MISESICESSSDPSQPDRRNQTGGLTDEQRAFAKVVGQALVEAWRRQWRQPTGNPPTSSR
jgi:hypothetical protein